MEPMTLGSPAQSPTSNPVNFTSPFLPAYLMGEQQSTSTPRHNSLSPSKMQQKNSPQDIPDNSIPRRILFTSPYNTIQAHESPSFNAIKSVPVEKSGPPVQGLFDTLDARYKYDPKPNPNNNASMTNPDCSLYQSTMFFDTNTSTPNKNVMAQQNLNKSLSKTNTSVVWNNNQWVTVFGFPQSYTNAVINYFVQCGNIIDKKIPNQGNWIHLKYSNQMEVNKALAFNGKIVMGNMMVGVSVCKNQQDIDNKENLKSISEEQSQNVSVVNFNQTPNRARPLAQSYISPQQQRSMLLSSATDVVNSPQHVPQKSTGLVTKAMEYVFGW